MKEIKTRLASGDAAEINRLAAETGLSISAITRQLLIQALHPVAQNNLDPDDLADIIVRRLARESRALLTQIKAANRSACVAYLYAQITAERALDGDALLAIRERVKLQLPSAISTSEKAIFGGAK